MRRFTLKERAVSLLLAAVLLLGLIPISGVLAKDDAAPTVRVTQDGAEVTAIDLPENEKTTLTAACKGAAAYQWQIQIPGAGVWVDIYDKTDAGCEVSSALVSSMLDSNNAARLRCTATVDETVYNSAAITVTLTESSAAAPQDEPLETAGYVVESETIIPPADSAAGDDTPADDTPADDTSAAQDEPAAGDDTSTAQDDTPAQGDSTTDDTAAEDNTAPADDTPAVQDDTPAAADGTDPTADPAANDTPAGDDTPAAQADPAAGDDTAPANDTPTAQDASVSAEGLSAGSSGRTAVYAAARGSTGLSVQLLGTGGEGAGVMPLADDPDLTTYTIRIKYLYDTESPDTNGSVANDYIATVASGTPLHASVQSPVRTGYRAYQAKDDNEWNITGGYWFTKNAEGHYDEHSLISGTTVTIDIDSVTKDVTYYVVYLPQETTFQVKSYLQNVLDDYYTFAGAATKTARVGDSVLLLDITGRQGYSRLQYDDAKVAADGSTVLEIYYDREYHLINFDLGGGYGVTPIYARYQTELRVAAPTRAGYVFAGWEVEKVMYNGVDLTGDSSAPGSEHKITDTAYASNSYNGQTFKATADALATELTAGNAIEMPAFDIRLKAKWTPQAVTYTVVYWLQNANDDAYSYLTSSTVNSPADTPIASTEFSSGTTLTNLPTAFTAADMEGNYKYYSYNEAKTRAMNLGTITVKGDSSTIINIYYDRNEYEIRYVYARAQSTTTNPIADLGSIVSGNQYYVENSNSGRYLTSEPINDGLVLGITPEVMTFTKVPDKEGYYYIQNSEGKYLSIPKDSKAYFVDDIHECFVSIIYGDFYIKDGVEKQYLNNYAGANRAAGWSEPDDGSRVTIYSPSYSLFYGSNSTGYGYNNVNFGKNEIYWNYSFSKLPDISPSYTAKSFVDSADGYTYFYISIKARYGANIADIWPCDAVGVVDSYTFGSWASSYNCEYRSKSSQNANIIGIYPTMSAELIEDPNKAIAQTMVAWWADTSKTAKHKYIMYYELLPEEDRAAAEVIQYGGRYYKPVNTYEFTCAHNGNTRCDPIQYDGLTCLTAGWAGGRLDWTNGTSAGEYTQYQFTVTSGDTSGYLYLHSTDRTRSYYIKNDSSTQYPVYILDGDITYTNSNYYLTTSRFLYNRSTHKLEYYNNGSAAKTPASITNLMYGQEITNYNITAEVMKNTYYPDNLEPGAYEFAGWYTTSEFVDGTEVNWASATIPNGDLILYAKWVPVQHTVTFYETYNDMVANNPIADNTEFESIPYANPQQIDHGATVSYPSTISRTGYTFVGWFYIDSNGDTKAFLPNNMPVNEDLKIYAEWQSETMIRYTIHYMQVTAVEVGPSEPDGVGIFLFADNKRYKLDFTKELTQIADDTTGQIQDGRTKTFTAKALPQLWGPDDPNNPTREDYCHNYYPLLASHAIMFDADTTDQAQEWESSDKPAFRIFNQVYDSENNVISYEVEYTFFYVKLDNINYTVKYLNAADGTNIFTDYATGGSGTKAVPAKQETTNEAITTESMKLINGYVPDEYQKRLVLTAFPRPDTDDNVITFYYTENPEPMYFVEHLIENADGTWTQMSREFGTGTEKTTIVRTANTYNGHTFNAEQAWVNSTGERIKPSEGENWVATNGTDAEGKAYYKGTYTGQKASGTLKKNEILVIRFYYTLETYPYRIEHRIVGKEGNDWLFGTEGNSTETGFAVYGAVITGDASDDNPRGKQWATEAYKRGYWVEGNQSDLTRLKRSITISTETTTSPSEATVNVITFWYVDSPVEIGYRVVADGKVGENGESISECYVSPSITSSSSHKTLNPEDGSVPYAGPGYRFVGWYKDAPCTDPVLATWVDGANNKLTPKPEGEYNILAAALYYAKFEPITLTIKKEAAADTTIGDKETFLFHVQGKTGTATAGVDVTVSITGAGRTTIAYLPAGEYTVTELTNWSWRYDCTKSSKSVTVTDAGNTLNSVTFTNTRNSKTWLGGENSIINKFAAVP